VREPGMAEVRRKYLSWIRAANMFLSWCCVGQMLNGLVDMLNSLWRGSRNFQHGW